MFFDVLKFPEGVWEFPHFPITRLSILCALVESTFVNSWLFLLFLILRRYCDFCMGQRCFPVIYQPCSVSSKTQSQSTHNIYNTGFFVVRLEHSFDSSTHPVSVMSTCSEKETNKHWWELAFADLKKCGSTWNPTDKDATLPELPFGCDMVVRMWEENDDNDDQKAPGDSTEPGSKMIASFFVHKLVFFTGSDFVRARFSDRWTCPGTRNREEENHPGEPSPVPTPVDRPGRQDCDGDPNTKKVISQRTRNGEVVELLAFDLPGHSSHVPVFWSFLELLYTERIEMKREKDWGQDELQLILDWGDYYQMEPVRSFCDRIFSLNVSRWTHVLRVAVCYRLENTLQQWIEKACIVHLSTLEHYVSDLPPHLFASVISEVGHILQRRIDRFVDKSITLGKTESKVKGVKNDWSGCIECLGEKKSGAQESDVSSTQPEWIASCNYTVLLLELISLYFKKIFHAQSNVAPQNGNVASAPDGTPDEQKQKSEWRQAGAPGVKISVPPEYQDLPADRTPSNEAVKIETLRQRTQFRNKDLPQSDPAAEDKHNVQQDCMSLVQSIPLFEDMPPQLFHSLYQVDFGDPSCNLAFRDRLFHLIRRVLEKKTVAERFWGAPSGDAAAAVKVMKQRAHPPIHISAFDGPTSFPGLSSPPVTFPSPSLPDLLPPEFDPDHPAARGREVFFERYSGWQERESEPDI